MKKRFLVSTFVMSSALTSLLLANTGLAQSKNFPSHCKPGEFAHINARMGDAALKNNRKILSLCADKSKEPFGQFIYRYGAIGNVELEQIATPKNKFFVSSQILGPKISQDIIYFTKGEYNFYISEAGGMGSGIGLNVFKSGKEIVNLFSGNEPGVDFETHSLVNTEKVSSPVFARRAPKDKL